ncbi:hypothetical protein AUTU_20710 [Aureibacter tunicatorum]|nr:hypothetical protein AUTU_20710 [Aureibacter tunicatorum]
MKIRKIINIYAFSFVAILALVSCSEEIDLNLRSADPEVVIEGVVTDSTRGNFVKLSYTTDYYDKGETPMISDALVKVFSDGEEYLLSEVDPGFYTNPSLDGNVGKQYRLEVVHEEVMHESEGYMRDVVEVDSVTVEETDLAGNLYYRFEVHYTDPADERNYYKIEQFVNGESTGDIMLHKDDTNDGMATNYPVYYDEIEIGDHVEFELQHISEDVYDYFKAVQSISEGNPSSPGNPPAMFGTDALGYFSVQAVSRGGIVLE